jgi:hypothetical protein
MRDAGGRQDSAAAASKPSLADALDSSPLEQPQRADVLQVSAAEAKLVKDLMALEVEHLTPLEALNTLWLLQQRALHLGGASAASRSDALLKSVSPRTRKAANKEPAAQGPAAPRVDPLF